MEFKDKLSLFMLSLKTPAKQIECLEKELFKMKKDLDELQDEPNKAYRADQLKKRYDEIFVSVQNIKKRVEGRK